MVRKFKTITTAGGMAIEYTLNDERSVHFPTTNPIKTIIGLLKTTENDIQNIIGIELTVTYDK